MLKQATALLTLTMLSWGCVSTGSNFPSRTDWIRKNHTDKDDVRLVLGSPYAIGNSGGTETWTYAFFRYKFPNTTFHKELRLYWNNDHTIKHYSFNSSFPIDIRQSRIDSAKAKTPTSEVTR